MTDNLNEKNKQVKDDFMNEISKVVKKNISENSDLTEEQVIGIAIRVLRPNDQTPKYDPKMYLIQTLKDIQTTKIHYMISHTKNKKNLMILLAIQSQANMIKKLQNKN